MGKENGEICRGRAEKQGRSNCRRTGEIECWKKFLCRGSTRCGWKTPPGSRGRVEVQIQRSDFSRRHARRVSRFGCLCAGSADRKIPGEQIDPTDRTDCRWKRRRTSGERARSWERRQQDQRDASEGARTAQLKYSDEVATALWAV